MIRDRALQELERQWQARQNACLKPGSGLGLVEYGEEECCVCKTWDTTSVVQCGNRPYVAACCDDYCKTHMPYTHKCGRQFCDSHGLFDNGLPNLGNDPAEGLLICVACMEFFDQVTPTQSQINHLNRLRRKAGMAVLTPIKELNEDGSSEVALHVPVGKPTLAIRLRDTASVGFVSGLSSTVGAMTATALGSGALIAAVHHLMQMI